MDKCGKGCGNARQANQVSFVQIDGVWQLSSHMPSEAACKAIARLLVPRDLVLMKAVALLLSDIEKFIERVAVRGEVEPSLHVTWMLAAIRGVQAEVTKEVPDDQT